MKDIDRDQILKEAEEDSSEMRKTENDPAFSDVTVRTVSPEERARFNPSAFKKEMASLNRTYYLNYDQPLGGRGLVSLIRKVCRKIAGVIVRPLTIQQNRFNGDVVRSLNQIGYLVRENDYYDQRNTVRRLWEREDKVFDNNEADMEKMRMKIYQLEKRVEELEKRLTVGGEDDAVRAGRTEEKTH